MFRVLIVDDEQIILKGIQFMIEKKMKLPFPVAVDVADSVETAIEKLDTFCPDLILTDIRMPDKDGFYLISYIQEKLMETDIVILTSHADFYYAQQAIRLNVKDFILKPVNVDGLKNVIEKLGNEKKERLKRLSGTVLKNVRDMMFYDLQTTDLDNEPEVLGQLFPHTYFKVIVISRSCVGEADKELFQDWLLKFYDICYCFVWQERGQVVAICNYQQKQDVSSILIKKKLQTLCPGGQIEVAVSISADSYRMLHSLYLNAVQRIFYRRNFGKNDILSGLSLITYQDCISLLSESDEIKVRDLLKEYLEKVSMMSGNQGMAEDILASFFNNIIFYLESSGISVSEDWMENRDPVDDFEQLLPVMEHSLKNLRECLDCNLGDQGDWLIEKLLGYISQHYREDISLEKLADYVGYNNSYISNVFKMKIGRSYLECIHSERLMAAKKLLLETDYIMEHIANEVGYNSASQFARVFRKYENMSPSEFRRKYDVE